MNSNKKTDRTVIYYILGGAAVGAVAGYIVKKVGMKNIINVLKAKKIIPENLIDTISEFTSQNTGEDLEEDEEDDE